MSESPREPKSSAAGFASQGGVRHSSVGDGRESSVRRPPPSDFERPRRESRSGAPAVRSSSRRSVLDSRGAGARKRGRLEPRGRPSLDGKATREDERATLDL
jgi:hypothetical protein